MPSKSNASKQTTAKGKAKTDKKAKQLVKKATPKAKPVAKSVSESKAKSVDVKAKSVSEPKVKAVAKPTLPRKINSRPVLAKTTGLNISPAKVKNVVSNLVLNRDSWSALSEIRKNRPHTEKHVTDGKEVETNVVGTPIAELSQPTRDYLAFATDAFDRSRREDFTREKVSAMKPDARSKYTDARNAAKSLHVKNQPKQFLTNSCATFDCDAFNVSFDKAFYADHTAQVAKDDAASKSDEWQSAIERITKLKSRFSTNSRVFLSAFAEYLIRQLAANGTVCCVADKKKIIQLSHVLDTSKEGFAERFPLYPLITNLDTFRQAQEHLRAKSTESKTPAPTEGETPVKKSPNTDLFKLDGVSLDRQYQFRYYVAETCRETRMDLASTEKDEEGNAMDVYNHTSVSKVFKNFCSTLVCEFLMRIGNMLETEISTRGIKTVNDTIIGAVISHYHTVCGVDASKSLDFIRGAASKYYTFVSERQQKRKDVVSAEPVGDQVYVE